MAGYMSPAGSFRAGYRWGKVAGGEVRFTAAIAVPDLDAFLQDPEHCAALTARLDYDGLGWDLPVKAGRFHLFCRRSGHTRMLYYLPFTCSGQRYLLFGQKFVGDRPGLHVWRDLTSLHTQLLRLGESDQPVGEPLAKGILTIGLPAVLRQLSTFRTFGASGPLGVVSLYARFLNGCTRELAEAYRLPLPNQRTLPHFQPLPETAEAPVPPPAQPAPPLRPSLAFCGDHVSFDELVEGLELGCMEYVLDEERVHRYLAATGADNPRYSAEAGQQRVAPPAVLASDSLKLTSNRYRIPGGIQVGQRLELADPPRFGKRIVVRGRLAEKFRHKNRPFFVLESTTEDEDGRLLLRSRTVNLLSLERETEDGRVEVSGPAEGRRFKQPSGQPLPPVVRLVNQEHMTLFEDEGRVSIHTDDDFARAHALPAAIAAGNHTLSFIVEMLHDVFGEDYLHDSVLDVRFVAPVYAGDRVRAGGVITQREPSAAGERLTIAVWCENQRGRLVAGGTAEVTLHSA
ncbi:MAG TPA: MaoC/PaaZ C-terminal domain-containing protein [Dehalococcoidia bacterium]|nr:MaoC/PaaZ C-terminal domain-containing protein [Dehalococcoidia bacterium]